MPPNVLIVGSGAMACLFAARFAAAGKAVGVLGGWPEGLAALHARGACLEDESGNRRCYPVDVSADPLHFKNVTLALVLVKAWQTHRAGLALATCLHPDGLALTLQNGLGNLESLVSALGMGRAAAGVTTLGSTLLEPGVARPSGSGETVLGAHPRLEPLVEVFQSAGLSVRVEDDLRSLLWGKLLVNAAINPLTALLNVPNGALLERTETRLLLADVMGEGSAVARALHIPLPFPEPLARVEQVLRQTASNRSSMLQDVQRGAPTEIEAITGELLRAAQSCDIDIPVNRSLYLLIKALQP